MHLEIFVSKILTQNYQKFIVLTSNMIYIIALGIGFKCPRKIHLNTEWGGGGQKSPILRRHSLWTAPKSITQLWNKNPFKIFISLNLALQIKRNIAKINSGYQGGHQDYFIYWLQTTRRNEFIFRVWIFKMHHHS